jgi:hypothetical protein
MTSGMMVITDLVNDVIVILLILQDWKTQSIQEYTEFP